MPIHDWSRAEDSIFHSFHSGWITALSDRLNEGLLPEGYYAAEEKRIEGMEPDVLTFIRRPGGPVRRGAWPIKPDLAGNQTIRTTATLPPKMTLTELGRSAEDVDALAANQLMVRRSHDDRVIAVIEIVSAGNKSSRGRFDAFLSKAVALVRSGVHLLVVDLHRSGSYDPRGLHAAIWARLNEREAENGNGAAAGRLTQASYLADDPPRAFVEPMNVGDELTAMPLFLTTEHYIEVPLAETYAERVRRLPAPWRAELEGGA